MREFYPNAKKTIRACAVLHNICLLLNDPVPAPIDDDTPDGDAPPHTRAHDEELNLPMDSVERIRHLGRLKRDQVMLQFLLRGNVRNDN